MTRRSGFFHENGRSSETNVENQSLEGEQEGLKTEVSRPSLPFPIPIPKLRSPAWTPAIHDEKNIKLINYLQWYLTNLIAQPCYSQVDRTLSLHYAQPCCQSRCLVRFAQKDLLHEDGTVLHGFNNFHNLSNAGLLESMKDVNLPYEI